MSYDGLMELADPAVFERHWDRVADGRTYTVKQGTDFNGTVNQYRNAIYGAAHRRALRVQTTIDRDAGTITFRFIVPPTEETPK